MEFQGNDYRIELSESKEYLRIMVNKMTLAIIENGEFRFMDNNGVLEQV